MGTGFFNGNGSTFTQIDPAEVGRFRDEAKASAEAAGASKAASQSAAADATASAAAALQSEHNAATSAATVHGSASAAAEQAGIATAKAAIAASSASDASGSASAAADKADLASTKAAYASTSATEAAVSASSSLSYLKSFRDVYYGDLPSDPATDPDGNPCGSGDLYFNSTYKQLRVFDGLSWQIYNPLAGGSTYVRFDAPVSYSDTQKYQVLSNIGISDLPRGAFYKSDWKNVAFVRTGNGTLRTATTIIVEVNGVIYNIPSNTELQMPALVGGTDYSIFACADQTLRVDSSFTQPSGYSGASRQIGGLHYAPGGNATARAGGNATPQINPYSLWDLKFRPACSDPRGMTFCRSFWVDIYLTGVDHHLNGTSKYNVVIADGSSPPKIPDAFGGNGSSVYGSLNWWEASEVMTYHGKELLNYNEFCAAAFGTTEGSSSGTDPVSTILREAYTSWCGVQLATGNISVWGRDLSYWPGANGADWKDQTGGRGKLFLANDTGVVAVRLGGYWGEVNAICGSRQSNWNSPPWSTNGAIGARGRCDHLCRV